MGGEKIKINESKYSNSPIIKRGRVNSVSLFEVTEQELEQLEQGTPSNLYLNFSILLITLSISFFIALSTAKIESERVFIVFTLVVIVGFIGSIILGVLWIKTKINLGNVVKKIRSRMS